MPIQAGRSLESYSLNEFKNLAEQSGDNQNLRIRKSNQELTNTPLGFFARYFGSTYSRSNSQVTQAFRHALQTDHKYHAIAGRLANVLEAQMPANQPLTAAKVKNAIGMAERMLAAQEKSLILAEMAEDFHLVSPEQNGAFRSFAMNYILSHPDLNLDLGNLGTQLTAEHQRLSPAQLQQVLRQQEGAKLETFSAMLKAFYMQAGPDAIRQGGYGVSPSQTGGDAQSAAAITRLLTMRNDMAQTTEAILNSAFSVQNAQIPKSGCLAKTFRNALSKLFTQALDASGMTQDLPGVLKMKANDINRFIDALNANAAMSAHDKTTVITGMTCAVNQFFQQHPNLALQPERLQQAFGQLTDKMIELVNQGNSRSADYLEAGERFAVQMLLNEQGLTVDGQSLFQKAGVDPVVGIAALSDPALVDQIVDKVKALGKERNDAQITQTVQAEVDRYLGQNAEVLRKVKNANLMPELAAAGVKTAFAMTGVLSTLSQGQARNEVQMLEQVQTIASALADKSLSDAQRGLVLKKITGELVRSLPNGPEQLCRDSRPVLARLVGQLQALSKDATISRTTRNACALVAETARAIYANLLSSLPAERQIELELVPEIPAAPDQNIAAAANPLKSFPRNASPDKMFAGLKELESSNLSAENKAFCRRAMESIGCPDYKLVSMVYSRASTMPNEGTPALTKGNQGYKVLSALNNDLSYLAHRVADMHRGAPDYDQTQIHEFIADVYLSGLTNEQKQNLLNALRDPAVQDYLQVVNSYAQKNEALPDNIIVPELLQIGNTGRYMAEAIKVLQFAADKAAQQLGQPAPGPIFDTNGTKTLNDLQQSFDFDDNFAIIFAGEFRKYCNPFDDISFIVGNNLNHQQFEAVKNLFGSLKVPVATDGIDRIHGQIPDQEFSFSFIDAQGHRRSSEWTPQMLATLFAFQAGEISRLLESTQGQPTPQQLWEVLHGGEPPAGLTMDNLADKVMRSMCQQIHAVGTLIGKPLSPALFFMTCRLKIGMSPKTFISKLMQCPHQDVTFTVNDQTGKSGLFPPPSLMGKNYEDGSHNFAFDLDFIRAGMPSGAQAGPNGEAGCKITVQPLEGEPVVFKQSDYINVPDDGKSQYLDQIPNEVRKLCQSEAQLAGVGICTTQAIQSALVSSALVYWNITGGSNEHTALDHHISKLPNGNVLVKVSEKPGSLFKLDYQFEVSPDGMVTLRPESSFTLPSLDKVRAYQQDHPGEIR